ncbi:MAG: ChbG/HpnK family deacetylase [Nitrospirae bacterium]|nr:ChbG/HpnK family deacetylase [Nitrospirota bacterium]
MNEKNLVVVADDLGRSLAVNSAVAEAHDRGILTAASMMVTGEAFEEAVIIVSNRRQLSVGLHVTLCDGRAVLPHSRVPGLTGPDGRFGYNPVRAWLKHMTPGIFRQIEAEVEAQFDALEGAGIRPTHVDSHHHLHMNPPIFEILCRQASQRGVGWIRLPKESLSVLVALRSHARGVMPFIEWAAFGVLGACNARTARKYGLESARRTYGLSRTGDVDTDYLLRVLDRIREPYNELFVHPDRATEAGRRELAALTSDEVRRGLVEAGIEPVGYRELSKRHPELNSACERT